MKLFRYGAARTNTPLWKVAEIAKSLGIPTRQLVAALSAQGAPKPRINGSQLGHINKRDWYEPKEVKRWYAQYVENDPAEKRREYHRMYAEKRRAT
jgi:hypothetical protein